MNGPADTPGSVRVLTHRGRPSIYELRCRSPLAIYPGTWRAALAFPVDLAPDEVYLAGPITRAAGGLLHHRFTLTPGPSINQRTSGGLLSVALSRGLLRVGVTHRPALWSPDVPRRALLRDATVLPTHSQSVYWEAVWWLTAFMSRTLRASNNQHPSEPHGAGIAGKLNWLRAGVLGANDGIVSVAAVVVGVAGATTSTPAILTAGIAALVGGSISMALGEYVSVSSQSDSQKALIAKERQELEDDPVAELNELAGLYEAKGLTPATARQVAIERTEHNALAAHLEVELQITEDEIASPWHAAFASALAFVLGAVLPLLAILLPPENTRVPITFVAVLIALAVTGMVGAKIGGSPLLRPTMQTVIGGALALIVTFAIGSLLGTSGLV